MKWAEHCFGSLTTSEITPDVYVVDNGSSDGTIEYIHKNYSHFIMVESKENLGFGKANNIGLQYAIDNNYDYVYLLNQDAWIFPETLRILIDISQNNPEYGIISPIQMNSDLYHIDAKFAMSSCSWKSNSNILSDFYNKTPANIYPVSYAMAAHWLITRNCLLQVGGFSPSFPHYGEDNNYVDRLHYWRMKFGIVPAVRVVHDRGERIDSPSKQMYLAYINAIRWLSSPNIGKCRSYINAIKGFNKLFPNIFCFDLVKYLIKILVNITSIIKNKKLSRKSCAFLES